jgi:hypothetical protein
MSTQVHYVSSISQSLGFVRETKPMLAERNAGSKDPVLVSTSHQRGSLHFEMTDGSHLSPAAWDKDFSFLLTFCDFEGGESMVYEIY